MTLTTQGGKGLFVETTDGNWSNLDRASAISVRPSQKRPGTWMVVAHFSGATPVIRDNFPSSEAARGWVADLLEDVERAG